MWLCVCVCVCARACVHTVDDASVCVPNVEWERRVLAQSCGLVLRPAVNS